MPGTVTVRGDMKAHEFSTSETEVTRAERVTITRWQLGMVAGHQECKQCRRDFGVEVELSREHAVECAGVADILGEDEAWFDGREGAHGY